MLAHNATLIQMLILIGSIIGIIMGLTGSGGSISALVLFRFVLDMPMKEATILSLFVVTLACFTNIHTQRKNILPGPVKLLLPFSLLGTYLGSLIKPYTADVVMQALVVIMASFALVNIWFSPNLKSEKSFSLSAKILFGISLGVITTLSGLGGGSIIIPSLMFLFMMNLNEAIATGLVMVGVTSFFSVVLQISRGAILPEGSSLFQIFLGTFSGSILVSRFSDRISESQLLLMKKILFSIIVIAATCDLFL